jgi:hypothetical protein
VPHRVDLGRTRVGGRTDVARAIEQRQVGGDR